MWARLLLFRKLLHPIRDPARFDTFGHLTKLRSLRNQTPRIDAEGILQACPGLLTNAAAFLEICHWSLVIRALVVPIDPWLLDSR